MKKFIYLITLFAFIFSIQGFAQQRSKKDSSREENMARPESFGLGLSLGMHHFEGDVQDGSSTFPNTKNPYLPGGNLFATWRLTKLGEDFASLHLIARVGYHPLEGESINGKEEYKFTDNALQGSGSLELQFFTKSSIRPFLYAGVGMLNYKPDVTATGTRYTSDSKYTADGGVTACVPVGIGLTWTASSAFDIFLNYEKTLTFSDKLDAWVSEINDNFSQIQLGVMFYFGRGEEQVVEQQPIPVVKDTDGDGLMDEDEIKIYKTDPTKKDTDGDGLMDGDEVRIYKTDPTNKDTDGDRLTDGDEVKIYKTDPTKKDTDGDGLFDGDEVLKYKTDPLKKDTDGDGLTDGDEVNKYKTDPLNPDTDSGSVNDGAEVARGSNPLDTKDDIPQLQVAVGKKIVLEGVVFKTGSAEILPASEEILGKAYNTLKDNPEIVVEIQGHTDNVGKRQSNMKLSKSRAESVKKWLVDRGIDAKRMSAKGFGPDQPIAANNTEDGRQKNRRIEFFRTK